MEHRNVEQETMHCDLLLKPTHCRCHLLIPHPSRIISCNLPQLRLLFVVLHAWRHSHKKLPRHQHLHHPPIHHGPRRLLHPVVCPVLITAPLLSSQSYMDRPYPSPMLVTVVVWSFISHIVPLELPELMLIHPHASFTSQQSITVMS